MQKRTKKGFTMIELVLVIAVVAVLAAVLIPTFSSLVEKANESAYLQDRQNDIKQDQGDKITDPKYMTWEDFEAALAEIILNSSENFTNVLEKYSGNSLTAEQIQAIIDKTLAGQLTTAQVEAIVRKAVASQTITDDQIKQIVNDAIAALDKNIGITPEEMEAAISEALNEAGLTDIDIQAIISQMISSTLDIQNIIDAVLAKQNDSANGNGGQSDVISEIQNTLTTGGSVKLSSDLTISTPINIPAGTESTLDLDGRTLFIGASNPGTANAGNPYVQFLTASPLVTYGGIMNLTASNNSPQIIISGTLTIKGGTIKIINGCDPINNPLVVFGTLNLIGTTVTVESNVTHEWRTPIILNKGTINISDPKYIKDIEGNGIINMKKEDVSENFVLNEEISIPSGVTATLDLNGKTLTAKSISNSGNLTVKNGALSIKGDGNYGITNEGTLNLENCTSISVSGNYAPIEENSVYISDSGNGIYNNGTLIILNCGQVSINGTFESEYDSENWDYIGGNCIYNTGSGTVTASGSTILSIAGSFFKGINNYGTLTLDNDETNVSVSASGAYGVYNHDSATISNIKVSVTGEIAYGIGNIWSELLTLTESIIEVDGTSATGYYSDCSQSASLSKVTITVNGDGNKGIYNSDSILTLTDESTITVDGSNSTAIQNVSVVESVVTVENTTITVNGSGSKGVINTKSITTIKNSEITVSGADAYAVHNLDGKCTVTIEDTEVTVSGSGAYGLHNGDVADTVTTINGGTFKAEGSNTIDSLIFGNLGTINVYDAEIIGSAEVEYKNSAPIALVETNMSKPPRITLKDVTITSNRNCIYSNGYGCNTTTNTDKNFKCGDGYKIFHCGFGPCATGCGVLTHYEVVSQ